MMPPSSAFPNIAIYVMAIHQITVPLGMTVWTTFQSNQDVTIEYKTEYGKLISDIMIASVESNF